MTIAQKKMDDAYEEKLQHDLLQNGSDDAGIEEVEEEKPKKTKKKSSKGSLMLAKGLCIASVGLAAAAMLVLFVPEKKEELVLTLPQGTMTAEAANTGSSAVSADYVLPEDDPVLKKYDEAAESIQKELVTGHFTGTSEDGKNIMFVLADDGSYTGPSSDSDVAYGTWEFEMQDGNGIIHVTYQDDSKADFTVGTDKYGNTLLTTDWGSYVMKKQES